MPPASTLDRRVVVASLLGARPDALVVTGLGSATYDVHAAGDRDATYYLWGAMGGAALVGLGIALAQPSRHVLVVTGDGEQLMAMGSFATIAAARAANLELVVVDNGRFGETGAQLSHTAHGTDLAAVATACGFPRALTVTDEDGLARWCGEAVGAGPSLAVIRVAPDNPPRSLPVRDAVFLKHRFRSGLGLPVS